jgi:hypothetical protein
MATADKIPQVGSYQSRKEKKKSLGYKSSTGRPSPPVTAILLADTYFPSNL